MHKFGPASISSLKLVHPKLVKLARVSIEKSPMDFMVRETFRGKQMQNYYFENGLSKLQWPYSKHNKTPAEAIHFIPYPLDWRDMERFRFLAGFVLGVASQLNIGIRWGGDWDGDGNFKDHTLIDPAHFELTESNNS